MKKLLILLVLMSGVMFGQSYQLAFNKTTTAPQVSGPMRNASVNQFHQLTVYAYDITAGSCSGGWSGVIYLEGSQDNVTYTQLNPGVEITSVGDNDVIYISAAGSFNYVIVDYVSGNTSACAISAWYSGTTTGYPSSNIPIANENVVVLGNNAVYSGQLSVTGTAAALSSQASKQVCLKASVGNTINVYVGNSGVTTSNGVELAPDEAVCLPVSNFNLLYVVASTTGASVSWIGTN